MHISTATVHGVFTLSSLSISCILEIAVLTKFWGALPSFPGGGGGGGGGGYSDIFIHT